MACYIVFKPSVTQTDVAKLLMAVPELANRGKVIERSKNPNNPIIAEVLSHFELSLNTMHGEFIYYSGESKDLPSKICSLIDKYSDYFSLEV